MIHLYRHLSYSLPHRHRCHSIWIYHSLGWEGHSLPLCISHCLTARIYLHCTPAPSLPQWDGGHIFSHCLFSLLHLECLYPLFLTPHCLLCTLHGGTLTSLPQEYTTPASLTIFMGGLSALSFSGRSLWEENFFMGFFFHLRSLLHTILLDSRFSAWMGTLTLLFLSLSLFSLSSLFIFFLLHILSFLCLFSPAVLSVSHSLPALSPL